MGRDAQSTAKSWAFSASESHRLREPPQPLAFMRGWGVPLFGPGLTQHRAPDADLVLVRHIATPPRIQPSRAGWQVSQLVRLAGAERVDADAERGSDLGACRASGTAVDGAAGAGRRPSTLRAASTLVPLLVTYAAMTVSKVYWASSLPQRPNE